MESTLADIKCTKQYLNRDTSVKKQRFQCSAYHIGEQHSSYSKLFPEMLTEDIEDYQKTT